MIKVGKMIHIADNQIRRNMDSIADKYDLTIIQFIVMENIQRLSKTRDVYQKDLEILMNVRRSTVSSVIGLLENKGFVKRQGVPGDARLKKLTLTLRGMEVFERLKMEIDEEDKRLMQVFTQEELTAFTQYLERLGAASADRSWDKKPK